MEIWLRKNATERLRIPVNPQSISADTPHGFEDFTLANGDEKTVIGGRSLRTFNFESFFPKKRDKYYYVLPGGLKTPFNYVNMIDKWQREGTVIMLQVTTTNINMEVTIRNFNWEEKGGTGGDIEFTIELKEYKPVSYTALDLKTPGKKASASNRPSSSKSQPTSYVVKPNDSLWKIAKAIYGDGSKKDKIYNANKSVIGKNPNKIKPGQKLVIPK